MHDNFCVEHITRKSKRLAQALATLFIRYVKKMNKVILITLSILACSSAYCCEDYSGRWGDRDHYYWIVEQNSCESLVVKKIIGGKEREVHNFNFDDKWVCAPYEAGAQYTLCTKGRWEAGNKELILSEARHESQEGGLSVTDIYFSNQSEVIRETKYSGGKNWGKGRLKKASHNKPPNTDAQ